jgi:hypothetical protein
MRRRGGGAQEEKSSNRGGGGVLLWLEERPSREPCYDAIHCCKVVRIHHYRISPFTTGCDFRVYSLQWSIYLLDK